MPTPNPDIEDIDYDAERAKLMVRFADGCAYVYVGVPGEVHRSFIEAESRVGYFADEICDCYPFNRLDA